jgi:hypothetical protein
MTESEKHVYDDVVSLHTCSVRKDREAGVIVCTTQPRKERNSHEQTYGNVVNDDDVVIVSSSLALKTIIGGRNVMKMIAEFFVVCVDFQEKQLLRKLWDEFFVHF